MRRRNEKSPTISRNAVHLNRAAPSLLSTAFWKSSSLDEDPEIFHLHVPSARLASLPVANTGLPAVMTIN